MRPEYFSYIRTAAAERGESMTQWLEKVIHAAAQAQGIELPVSAAPALGDLPRSEMDRKMRVWVRRRGKMESLEPEKSEKVPMLECYDISPSAERHAKSFTYVHSDGGQSPHTNKSCKTQAWRIKRAAARLTHETKGET